MSSLAQEGANEEGEQNDHYQEPSKVESLIYESIEDPRCLVDDYLDSNFDHISEQDQSRDSYDMVVSELDQEHCNEDPYPDNIDRILHPILNQNMLVQCVDIDVVLNLEITPRINLKALSSHPILRSIIPSLGENFQSTLPSQLFKSSCMGLSFSQVVTFKILNQDFKH